MNRSWTVLLGESPLSWNVIRNHDSQRTPLTTSWTFSLFAQTAFIDKLPTCLHPPWHHPMINRIPAKSRQPRPRQSKPRNPVICLLVRFRPITSSSGKYWDGWSEVAYDLTLYWLCFSSVYREERAKILEEREEEARRTGQVQDKSDLFAILGKTIAARWKAVNEEKRQKYKEMASDDMKRYRAEMDQYHESIAKSYVRHSWSSTRIVQTRLVTQN